MKVFQIVGGFCHWHARNYGNAEDAKKFFPPDCVFVDAPDDVFEGWGYYEGEFIKPTPPEGWCYDDATGTFYQADEAPPASPLTMQALAQENQLLKAQLVMQKMHSDLFEDCLIEIAETLYA